MENDICQSILNQLHQQLSLTPSFFWPLSPGQYLALFLLLMAILLTAFYLSQRTKSIQAKSLKVLQLRHLAYRQTPTQWVHQVHQLLRQIAIAQYGHQKIANLQTEQWIQLLQKSVPKANQSQHDLLRAFVQAQYQGRAELDPETNIQIITYWIKNQKKIENWSLVLDSQADPSSRPTILQKQGV